MNFLRNLFKKKKTGPVHDWVLMFSKLTEDHKQNSKYFKCKDCSVVRQEYESVQEPIEVVKVETDFKDDPNAVCWCKKCGTTLIPEGGVLGESLCGNCA